MTITRRELLRRAGMLGAATLIPSFTACTSEPGAEGETGESGTGGGTGTETGDTGDGLPVYEWDGEAGPESMFSHGVASGDPLADSVILWTRVSPAAVDEAVETFFEMAIDPAFEQRVAADWIPATTSDRDHTVKIDIEGLLSGTTYYYRFYAQGRVSPIGRTRTAPEGAVDHLRFAVCSCSSWAHGHFHVYEEISGRADIDALLHLGDYIYEFGNGEYGDVQEVDPPYEIVSLDDYRRRYRLYRTSRGLQAAHRQHPFITTWDDHEITNDGWMGGAANHDDSEGPWEDRKAAATQAYFEWLPLREGEPGRLYRYLPFGDLVDLIVLDTRYEGREQQINLNTNPDPLGAITDPDRQMLGVEQENWLFDRLSESTATWILLAQQVMFGQTILQAGQNGEPNRPLFSDPWDGYDGARRRIYSHLRDNGIGNLVVLTGDVHSSFAVELTEDPLVGYQPGTGEGSVAVEFVTPGVTSPGLGFDDTTLGILQMINPHWRWLEVLRKGYMTIDVTPERVQADFFLFTAAQVGNPNFTGSTYEASWAVEAGTQVLVEADAPAPEKADPPPLAP